MIFHNGISYTGKMTFYIESGAWFSILLPNDCFTSDIMMLLARRLMNIPAAVTGPQGAAYPITNILSVMFSPCVLLLLDKEGCSQVPL